MAQLDKKGEETKALLASLDKNADPLHADITPAVLKLIDRGIPGAAAVLEWLDAPQRLTRMRAQRVLDGVVAVRFGWRSGTGFPSRAAKKRVQELAAKNGNYSVDAPAPQRRAAIEQWRRWLRTQAGARRRKEGKSQ